eukprot:COSAG02_NODE_1542_length_12011_cov_103.068754_4_plen_52_part_00
MSVSMEKFFVLRTRVDGRGRLIPTPALSKIMLHRSGGGFRRTLIENRTLYC